MNVWFCYDFPLDRSKIICVSQTLSSENVVYFPLAEMMLEFYFCCRGVTAVPIETLLCIIFTYSGITAKACNVPGLRTQFVSHTETI